MNKSKMLSVIGVICGIIMVVIIYIIATHKLSEMKMALLSSKEVIEVGTGENSKEKHNDYEIVDIEKTKEATEKEVDNTFITKGTNYVESASKTTIDTLKSDISFGLSKEDVALIVDSKLDESNNSIDTVKGTDGKSYTRYLIDKKINYSLPKNDIAVKASDISNNKVKLVLFIHYDKEKTIDEYTIYYKDGKSIKKYTNDKVTGENTMNYTH